jgi:hypothetical protein
MDWENRVSGKILARKFHFAGPPIKVEHWYGASDRQTMTLVLIESMKLRFTEKTKPD